MSVHFILSADGGGIRGVLTARIIQRLEDTCAFLKNVDCFAGTSTGGIIAIGLALGMKPSELVALYRDNGAKIFSPRDLRDRLSRLDELYRADYSSSKLQEVLYKAFNSNKLGDLDKRVLIPTFQLSAPWAHLDGVERWKPKYYHNYPGSKDVDTELWKLGTYTASAPTFFPSFEGHVDGGVAANNPSMCAIAKALKAGHSLEDIHVLSIGTGVTPRSYPGDHDWGMLNWAPKLVPLFMEASDSTVDYQCRQILGNRYRRIQVVLNEEIDLDGVKKIPTLLKCADEKDTKSTHAWLHQFRTSSARI